MYRPAAIEQLKTVSAQVGADFFPSSPDQKPIDIANAALDWAKRHYHDVLIVDTAGRLGIDEQMMQEIKSLHASVKPIETLFVVDAMLGQDAVNTARAFHEALPLSGVILTKLDGDSRGGAALSVRHITGVPIKFIGVAEKMDGLEAFDAERMTNRILGMGDILALVEQVTAIDDGTARGNHGVGRTHGQQRLFCRAHQPVVNHQVHVGAIDQGLGHLADAPLNQQIVVTQELDELAAGLLKAGRQVTNQPQGSWIAHVTHYRAGLLTDRFDNVFDLGATTVIADDDLEIAVTLADSAVQRPLEKARIEGGNDKADERE